MNPKAQKEELHNGLGFLAFISGMIVGTVIYVFAGSYILGLLVIVCSVASRYNHFFGRDFSFKQIKLIFLILLACAITYWYSVVDDYSIVPTAIIWARILAPGFDGYYVENRDGSYSPEFENWFSPLAFAISTALYIIVLLGPTALTAYLWHRTLNEKRKSTAESELMRRNAEARLESIRRSRK